MMTSPTALNTYSNCFFNDAPTTEIYTFPYTTLFRSDLAADGLADRDHGIRRRTFRLGEADRNLRHRLRRSEEHTSELQSQFHLVCRLLLEKKNENLQATRTFADKPPRFRVAAARLDK